MPVRAEGSFLLAAPASSAWFHGNSTTCPVNSRLGTQSAVVGETIPYSMIFSDTTDTHSPLGPDLMGRRRMIGGLGLTGLGLLATSAVGNAFTLGGSPKVTVHTQSRTESPQGQRIDLTGLPPEWARQHGPVIKEYAHYLANLKLKSISAAQVIEAHAKNHGTIWNTLPPKSWWTRMGYTLRVADRVALEMGVNEVEVISAYRSPAYNAHCEGAKARSWHQANVAVDVKFPARASKVTAAARNLRQRGLFKGGVGGYWNFTHIDTRGVNIDW